MWGAGTYMMHLNSFFTPWIPSPNFRLQKTCLCLILCAWFLVFLIIWDCMALIVLEKWQRLFQDAGYCYLSPERKHFCLWKQSGQREIRFIDPGLELTQSHALVWAAAGPFPVQLCCWALPFLCLSLSLHSWMCVTVESSTQILSSIATTCFSAFCSLSFYLKARKYTEGETAPNVGLTSLFSFSSGFWQLDPSLTFSCQCH